MPAFSRSFSSKLFVLLATLATLGLIVSLTAGGFLIQIGALRLSVRQPLRPFIVAVLCWAIAAWHGRAVLRAALSPIATFIHRHAGAIAVVIAAATAGAGVAYGTYSASSADSSGYVSQSALLADGRTTIDEPLARQVDWADATWAFSPLGYRPGDQPGLLVPTYAPGLPLAMAAARVLTGTELALYLVVPLLGAAGVFATYRLGALFHSRTAGIIAAALLATSPIFLFQLSLAMSDVPAAALWAVAFALAASSRPFTAVAAGAAAGFAVLVRPNLVPLALPAALLAAGWLRGHEFRLWRVMTRLALFAAGLAPAVIFQALLQWHLYGDPLRSGYGTLSEIYSLSYVSANARGYAARILSSELPALLLAMAALVASFTVGRRLPALTPTARIAWLAATVSALMLLGYLPYLVFPEWHFLRFLLPAFPPVFALIGALAANALQALPPATRGLALLLALAAACGVNIATADRESAFRLRDYEARYRTAGRYLESALPPNAVIVSVQESGSARYYTGRPIYRWDSAPNDLDAAIATLTSLGRRPVLLIEDFEEADIRRRFPRSPLSRLDWTPRADFGTVVRVRLFDPADRTSTAAIVTDRLP